MRIIARLDIKQGILIKSIMFDGVKKLGDPKEFAQNYYDQGIDELLLINNTGSLYNTKIDSNLIKQIRSLKAIPISAGGGIKSLDDAKKIIDSGCDKIVINSLIHNNYPEAEKIINCLGSASVIGAIQFEKKKLTNNIQTFYEMARENTGLTLKQCISKYKELGVGELLLTDVSRDGIYSGLSEEIMDEIEENKFNFPLLISGGFKDISEMRKYDKKISGIIISSSFHYKKIKVEEIINFRNKNF
tara:strand:- start:7594 stop:8328 length:735 start_codon:yes stop_codon:yes gene_type:complete